MRAELPPVCRLTAVASTSATRPSARHRALADAEDKLQRLVSCHSLAQLGNSLADPTLKLDEVSFLARKCRQISDIGSGNGGGGGNERVCENQSIETTTTTTTMDTSGLCSAAKSTKAPDKLAALVRARARS